MDALYLAASVSRETFLRHLKIFDGARADYINPMFHVKHLSRVCSLCVHHDVPNSNFDLPELKVFHVKQSYVYLNYRRSNGLLVSRETLILCIRC